MDIEIIKVVLDIFDEYGETIRFDKERFEEALNDEAPQLLDECYLVVLGFQSGVFDAMIFDEDIDVRGYVDYLTEVMEMKEDEAVFLTSVMLALIDQIGYYFEIPQLDELVRNGYQNGDFHQLAIIAKAYFLGFGVPQDYEKSFEIYSYLYGHGNDIGAYYLGYMYENGYGIEKNIEKALMYYQNTEDDLCTYRLGIWYMEGHYVEQDNQRALDYLSKSQYPDAYLYRGILLNKFKEYALAFEAYLEGAKLYHIECIYRVGLAFRNGFGVVLDLQQARHYFELGYYFLQGDCAFQMALVYFDGLIVPRDENRALHYLRQAVVLESLDATIMMAGFYKNGKYVEQDLKKSAELYKQANEIQDYKSQGSFEGKA